MSSSNSRIPVSQCEELENSLLFLFHQGVMCALRPFGWGALLDLIVVPRAGGALSSSEFRLPGP